MPQQLTLVLTEEIANGLIETLQTGIKTHGYNTARIAVPIISELLRQDAEYKKLNPQPTLPTVPNQTAE
jgi:hypothetical protein